MKRLLLFVFLILTTITSFGFNFEKDLIITFEETYQFEKVKIVRKSHIVGITSDGKKIKFNLLEVKAFKIGKDYYKKMPLLNKTPNSKVSDFMKEVCQRGEMTLYEYSIDKNKTLYYVFRNENLVMELNSHEHAHLIASFALK